MLDSRIWYYSCLFGTYYFIGRHTDCCDCCCELCTGQHLQLFCKYKISSFVRGKIGTSSAYRNGVLPDIVWNWSFLTVGCIMREALHLTVGSYCCLHKSVVASVNMQRFSLAALWRVINTCAIDCWINYFVWSGLLQKTLQAEVNLWYMAWEYVIACQHADYRY